MASFLGNFKKYSDMATEMASEYLKPMLAGGDPYKVQATNMKDVAKFRMLSQDGCLSLYNDGAKYICVLYCPQFSNKAFSLFTLKDDTEATKKFSAYSHQLAPLYLSSRKVLDEELLNQICKWIRDNPTWTSAHLAAKAELQESFKQNGILDKLEVVCESTGVAPIHVAVNTGNYEVIQELLLLGIKLNVADREGENVFHYAAKICDSKVLQMLASRDASAINQLNMYGESALHTACLHDKPDNVETLLRWGADPCKTMSTRFPIHCAVKVSSTECVETLVKWNRTQLHVQDSKYGGTPLHWAKNREILYKLLDLGCNPEVKSHDGDTALQIMIKRQRLPCVMALLSRSVDAASVGSEGNNALHLAISIDDSELVQALIVFGCDVNGKNKLGHSPRHVAATGDGKNKNVIIYLLHCVGAQRCRMGVKGCREGCGDGYFFDGVPKGVSSPDPEDHTSHVKMFKDLWLKINTHDHPRQTCLLHFTQSKVRWHRVTETYVMPTVPNGSGVSVQFYDNMVTEVAMAAALTRSASATGSAIMDGNSVDSGVSNAGGDRILSLDGGGIRGLVLIQLLLAVEKAAGQPIINCFDWIGGTSTGGILALAILHGKTMRYAQGLYFRLKDEVFVGKRPYEAEPLENFMKREFGEHTRMTEVEYPRVLVTGCMSDRKPCALHFFRNYDPPGIDYKEETEKSKFPAPPPPNDTYVWKAARSSGAAPTYFRSMGRFLDGGLMANNPTLDVLTEIHQHNMNLKALGQGSRVQPMHVVVSLGTGKMPVQEVKYADVYRPEGIFDVAKVVFGARELAELMIDQATQSEGRPVDRARAWCSMIDVPFFRFSPQLSENIPLDCTDDRTLINMLWETQCYIYQNWGRIQQLAILLKS